MFCIRPANKSDISGIMAVEQTQFGQISENAMASELLMQRRIELCNFPGLQSWFFVAEIEGKIEGYVIVQPTSMSVDICTSWEHGTDFGTMEKTFDRNGKNLYIVSLAVLPKNKGVTFPLILQILELWKNLKFHTLMFCSRMPGWRSENLKTNISPEEYWKQINQEGDPKDWMLRLYYKMGGSPGWPECARLLLNGYSIDIDSGGHGVLFGLTDAQSACIATKAFIKNSESNTLSEQAQLGDAGISNYWDVYTKSISPVLTLYLPFGCPDWDNCTFCGLHRAVGEFSATFYKGEELSNIQHITLFQKIVERYNFFPGIIAVFNAGSFLQMDWVLQKAILMALLVKPGMKQLIIEARAVLITENSIRRITDILDKFNIQLTIRIGIETKDANIRNVLLKKGQSEKAINNAVMICHRYNVRVGAYIMLKPWYTISNEQARIEALHSIYWVLDILNVDEVYFSATFIVEGTPLFDLWSENKFILPTLWDIVWVLKQLDEEKRQKVVLLPFEDEPQPIAIPSSHKKYGVRMDLQDASDEDKKFHYLLEEYRRTMEQKFLFLPNILTPPDWF
jgi:radical SAM enzyme (TIGR01210 family)